MSENLEYRILELKEDGGALWAKIEPLTQVVEPDLALVGALEELERRAAPYGMKKSEALNWMLGHPNLDEFFGQILEHKKRVVQ